MKKTIGRVAGPLGALLVAFALFFALKWGFTAVTIVELVLGVVGLVVYGFTAFDDMRNIATGRGSAFVVTSAASTAAVVVALVSVNYWAVSKRVEWDFTKGGIHTLSGQTRGLLAALGDKTSVKVTAFYRSADPEYAAVEELLRRYKNTGGEHFEYEFVDLYKSPSRAQAKSVTPTSPRIILESAAGKESRAKEPTEEALTNALAELGRGAAQTVYFLGGHGEKPLVKGADSGPGLKLWADGLRTDGYRVEELSLLARKDVPEDAQIVVVAGPRAPLADGERDALERFADGGGRLVLMLDPGFETNLEPLLAKWGVQLGQGTVVDPASQEALWAFTQAFSDHPLASPVRSIFGALPFVFPDARLVKKGPGGDGYTVTELFHTGKDAWGENTPLEGQQAVGLDPEDDRGPVPLGVAVSRKLDGDQEMRAVVYGDSDFASNSFVRQYGNRDLALNTIEWLAGQEQKITIRPKMREKSTLAVLSADQRRMLEFGSLNLLPLVLIAFGLSVWSLRKSK